MDVARRGVAATRPRRRRHHADAFEFGSRPQVQFVLLAPRFYNLRQEDRQQRGAGAGRARGRAAGRSRARIRRFRRSEARRPRARAATRLWRGGAAAPPRRHRVERLAAAPTRASTFSAFRPGRARPRAPIRRAATPPRAPQAPPRGRGRVRAVGLRRDRLQQRRGPDSRRRRRGHAPPRGGREEGRVLRPAAARDEARGRGLVRKRGLLAREPARPAERTGETRVAPGGGATVGNGSRPRRGVPRGYSEGGSPSRAVAVERSTRRVAAAASPAIHPRNIHVGIGPAAATTFKRTAPAFKRCKNQQKRCSTGTTSSSRARCPRSAPRATRTASRS